MKKIYNVLFAAFVMLVPVFGFAQGLDAASDRLDEFRVWAYGFLAIACLVYMLYKVVMALLERQAWGDVAVGLGHVAIAGGIIAGAEFMWSIWGS